MRVTGRSTSSIYATAIFLSLSISSSFSLADGIRNELSAPGDNSSEDVDLVSFLSSRSQQHDAIFTEAVHLLESIQSSPSCNRIAATRLVTSCQSIGGHTDKQRSNTYASIDHVRSLYAARLAICELNGAGASIPPPCVPVTASPPQKKGIFGFKNNYKPHISISDSIPKSILESCLKSLESRPQWWTSYSNSRQNAVVICQAARIEREKEELLDLHRSIVESSLKLNHGLQEALRMAAEESSQHRVFMRTTEAIRAQLVHDLEQTESRFTIFAANVFRDIELSVGSVVTSITSVLGGVQTEATMLEKDIKNVSSEVNHLQDMLRTVHVETLARNQQLTDTQQRDALAHHQLASSIQSSLESVIEGDMARLLQNVVTFDASLEWLSGKMDFLLQQETKVTERLRTFEMSLGESEMKAEGLRQAQKLQLEAAVTQSQAQENLQTNMQISQALLDKATATAANLQAMIDESATRYRESPALGGFLGAYSTWTVCALLFSIIGAQNPKSALALLFIGIAHMAATKILY